MTIPGIVGDCPGDGGSPSLGQCMTILGMVDELPVTILGMVSYHHGDHG